MNGFKEYRTSLDKEEFTFYDIKGVFESIMQILGLDFKRYKLARLTDNEYFHPGRSAKILIGKDVVGVMGELHPTYSKEFGRTYVLDMNLSKFLMLKTSQKKMQVISKFPSVERDYALVVKKDVTAEEMISSIKKQGSSMISSVEIFDVYEGEFLPIGFKSIAFKVKYSSLEKTLTDNDINPVEEKIISALNSSFGAYLRS